MLTRLRLQNFKAWEDTGEVRLAPLTVLFGANSAGKTSIPQLLLLLKQTAAASDRQRALQLGDAHSLVDLGTWEELVFERDVSRKVEFLLEWNLETPHTVREPISHARFRGDRLRFSARIGADARRQPRTESLSYALGDAGGDTLDLSLSARSSSARAQARGAQGFELSSQRYPLARNPGRTGRMPAPLRFYGFPDEVAAYHRNTAFADDLVLALERMLGSVLAVGPLREPPRRLYVSSGERPTHVGMRGERTVEALVSAGKRTFQWRPRQKPRPLQALVAERLLSMGLIQELQVKPLGRRRQEYEVWVRTSRGLPLVKLTDVGFGVSQVLPIIVESFYVPRRSIVILEQPELHLHPRVQGELADLFVDAVHARENGVARDCQFIVESHSEHFLRRLQRRIAEGALAKEDAALYFVDTRQGRAQLEELRVDDYGNILNWPPDFFGDELGDLVARSEAQARRMQAQEKPR